VLERELEVAARLAREAGEVLRRHAAAGLSVTYKGPHDPVTDGDLHADEVIVRGLSEAFPDDALLSEERPDPGSRLGARRVWIVDPVDGTSNYARGGDEHAVSIGLAVDGRAVLGAVYNPVRDELILGAEGHGVTLNGEPARVSAAATLEGASLIVSSSEWRVGLSAAAAWLPIRPVSSVAYKLARVAAGLDDAVFTAAPRNEWDVCGGVALVLAAGGVATLRDGRAVAFNEPVPRLPLGIAAANPTLHAALLEAFAAVPASVWRDAQRRAPS
jgi:myo-inositol-1(or 4)-monophosphatase